MRTLPFKIPHLRAAALAAVMVLAPLASQAGQVTSRYGALDGLGIGVGDGQAFEFLDLLGPEADGTNGWAFGGFSAQIDSAWIGTLTGASLQVFAGGWGYNGAAAVFLNNQQIGTLSVGEDANGTNTAHLDQYDLGAFLGMLTGQDLVEIRTVDVDDGGVLGYFQLSLQTQTGGGGTAPEPTSAWLVAAALAAGVLARRRRA
ncbi:PEP-CTERM sorting domain-containing protein [Aquabacterium sp. OR-4]|uniref:PEP-CTERM sorting domain-containing protein n=1 Tax=Aquabacterium sp. OR-4 TaxID=2978127 RepID=UPI0021B3B43D|nr:PEP-CTERM sorting domain-containing protein [Aquabacterium sp. OR-4]MDT7838371.1 PEP-CTERM sorting domain-containing protein [Aquabacterium sp. OR-4]